MSFLLSFLCLFAFGTEKLTIKGEVYDLKGQSKLFEYERYVGDDGLRSLYKDTSGNLSVEEKASIQNGSVQSYQVTQHQTQEKGKIEIKDGKVWFGYVDSKGKSSKASEKLESNFVVPMTLVGHLVKNWETLAKGDSIRVRLGVWYRQETVGFKFWKEKEYSKDGKELMVVVMKPTSWVIRAIVDPLRMTFDKNTKDLVAMKGRTTPKIKVGSQWKDLDALTKFKQLEAGR